MKVNYDEIKQLSKEEILAKMKAGELIPPPPGPDRKEFQEFAGKSPEERDAWLKSRAGKTPDPAPSSSPDGAGGEANTQGKAEDAPVKDSSKPQTWWEKRGYSTEEEATAAIDNLREFASKQKENFDRLNADRGKLGSRLKDLESELVELRKLKKPAEKRSIARPERPKRPKVSEFDDGALDPKYHEAIEAYEESLGNYEVALEEYLLSAKSKDPEIESRLKRFEETIESTNQSKVQRQVELGYEEMWTEARQAQKEFGLHTSNDLKQINEVALVLDPARASLYDESEKTAAKKLWSSFPEADRKAFKAMTEILAAQYDFSGSVPTKRFKSRDAALIEAGLSEKYKKRKPTESGLTPEEIAAQQEAKRRQNDQYVSTPPSSSLQSGDPIGPGAGSGDKERLLALGKKYLEATKAGAKYAEAFESGPEFKEYINLRKKITGRLPDFKRYQ